MKRRIFKLGLFLLLGAMINVAVAWGFALRRASLAIERYQQGGFVIWGRPWQIVQQHRLGMIDVWWYDLNDDNPRSESAEALISFRTKSIMQRRFSTDKMPSGRSVELL